MTVPVIVFAKAPVPGAVKTRLARAIGREGASRLYGRFVEHVLDTAKRAGLGPVELCCTPDTSHPFFAAPRASVTLTEQGPGDLGERMLRALARALRTASAAILIGSDCPALEPRHLADAAARLAAGDDAVLGPAEDGGYVLLGARRVDTRLFEGIDWGGPEVLNATRRALGALGWRWGELETLWDVDRPEDLSRLARDTRLAHLCAGVAGDVSGCAAQEA